MVCEKNALVHAEGLVEGESSFEGHLRAARGFKLLFLFFGDAGGDLTADILFVCLSIYIG